MGKESNSTPGRDHLNPQNNFPQPFLRETDVSEREVGASDQNQANESTKEEPEPHQAGLSSRTKTHYLRDSWFWEAVSLLSGFVCLFAIIILLKQFDGMALSSWGFYFQLNTVISVLIFVVKSCILISVAECISQLKWQHFVAKKRALAHLEVFDQASRGVLGSLNLIWNIGMQAPVALLGAVVTIAALLMDPLAQQLVLYETTERVSGEHAKMPISNVYDAIEIWERNGSYIPLSDTAMEGAFYAGLFNTNESPRFHCPSGNCAWEDFYSLGVCSSCATVTRSRTFSLRNCTEEEARSTDTCIVRNYHMPSNLTLDIIFQTRTNSLGNNLIVTQVAGAAATGIGGNWLFAHRGRPWEHLDNIFYTADVLAVFAVARLPFNIDWDLERALADSETLIDITDCQLRWCLKKYQHVEVKNGTLSKFTTQETPLVHFDGGQTFTANISAQEVYPFDSNEVTVMGRNIVALEKIITRYMNFHLASNGGNMYPYNWSPAQMFWESNNHSGVVENIAASMTDRIRVNSRDIPMYANGQVFRPVTLIRVKWLWLILPIALVTLTAALLARALICIPVAPLWKSRLLPLFFRDLESEEELLRGVKGKGKIEEAASQMHIRLEKREGGASFICYKKQD
ncbi:uncharacterized protein BDR25DRAFT_264100 [Lindgomyces ingoldianus]|uniref:Uncharacterized protein n=1 Tax=Lindgomyces ingoldianus TaxID=673940 RepID=A0ACB6QRA3_9PLEO|nr:uncharacterized protein BDR25DRAFT_264100 [Lindgomyces ingoldianus]KAF2469513.1 hypothetical protein BDR25DRAFT_264100 [Lindgomyces ingoldianus]